MTAPRAIIATMVEVTPTQLREIANLLELSSQRSSATETTMVSLTERISFVYQPSPKVADQIKEKSGRMFEGSLPSTSDLAKTGIIREAPGNPQSLG